MLWSLSLACILLLGDGLLYMHHVRIGHVTLVWLPPRIPWGIGQRLPCHIWREATEQATKNLYHACTYKGSVQHAFWTYSPKQHYVQRSLK